MAKLVHPLLTLRRVGSLFSWLGSGERIMAVLEQPKAKVARIKRNPQPMSLDEFFDATSKRYPKIIARLAE